MGDIIQGLQDQTPRGAAMVQRGHEATGRLNTYLEHEIERRRTEHHDDLISTMMSSEVARTRMSAGEVVASNTQLVFAGNETTAKLMSHVLLALAQHPDLRRRLAQDRALIPPGVEEIHRWNSVRQVTWRTVRGTDAVIDGHHLPVGSVLMLLRGAANRDPQRLGQPRRTRRGTTVARSPALRVRHALMPRTQPGSSGGARVARPTARRVARLGRVPGRLGIQLDPARSDPPRHRCRLSDQTTRREPL